MSQTHHGQAGRAALAVAFTAFLWSTAGLCVKVIDWNPFVIAGLRSFIAGTTMLIFLRRPVFTFSFPQVAAGVTNAMTMLLFVSSTKLTTAANAILLQYCAPILVAILGWIILKEKPRWEHWTGLALICVGICVFFLDKVGAGNRLGDFLALASGLTFALHSVFLRRQKDGSPVESIMISHALVAFASIPFIFMNPPSFTLKAAGAVLFLGVFQVGIASFFFAYGIKRIPALQTMLIATLEPILNPVWVFLLIGERPSVNAIIGGIIIVVSVTFCSVISARREAARQN
ncbi:MAG: DMT family transporter [Spirochaetales bacterium]|jgi:drug/metabolite transporter (DMT)-like permease|nr:DMT family transporter [Spirochaetales bacterium]